MKAHVLGTGALALTFAVLHAGCSSKDDPAPAADAGASSGQLPPGTDGGGECGKTANADQCAECCRDGHLKEADVYTAYIFKCYCQPGPDFCKEICKDTFCGTVSPEVPDGDPCNDCLAAKDAACGADANAKCKADPACAVVVQCLDESACLTRP